MTVTPISLKSASSRRELILLLLASISCVVVLTVGIARSGPIEAAWPSITQVLLVGLLIAGAVATGYLVWRTTNHVRLETKRLRDENLSLRRRLASAESVIGAEPQVLLYWEIGGALTVVSNTLFSVRGLPEAECELLAFTGWLDSRSADTFEAATRDLFQDGRAFNVILKTRIGGHLEADGRASAGRAVMKLRDISGYKRDISRINDTFEQLERDVDSSRALLNCLPMPTWLKDPEGRLTWVNDAFVRAVEAHGVDDVVENQTELLETRQRQTINGKVKTGATYREQLPIIVDGERRKHNVIVVPYSDGFAGAAIDIADFESAQGEFARQVETYDWTLDRVATAVAIFNPAKELVYSNPAFAGMWDLDTAWLESGPMGWDVFDRLRGQDRLPSVINYSKWRSEILRLDGCGEASYDDWWHVPGGRLLHVVSELRDDGSTTFLFTDETEQLALKSQFNALVRVQSETLDSLSDGVAVFATDGRIKLHNRAFASIWKLSREMLEREPHIEEFVSLARVLYDDEATWSRLKMVITAFSDMRTPIDGQMIRPDNSVIDFATTPLPDGATLLTFVDVTDSRRYERALVERNEALLASDRLKNQFISSVSYELRTPLTNIIGFSELLESPHFGELNEQQTGYVRDINFSSKTLLSIIDGILDLATLDAGDLKLSLEDVKVRDVIDSALAGVSERAAHAGLTIDIGISDDTQSFVADGERVRRIIYNLLSNAVGFSNDDGEVRLTCFSEDGDVVFQIEDEGIGIARDAQSHVFDRFVSDSQGSKHRGVGLGLSVTKGLVELHGGKVSLVSEPNEGTTVTVRFPAKGRLSAPSIPSDSDQPLISDNRAG